MNRTITKALAVAAALSMGVTTLAACGSSNSVDESKGKVYYLNFKPEAADQWKAIAETYTKETGVQVTIETAASGTYEQTLKSEMAKDQAPTLFQVNGPVGYARWKDYCDDMSDTAVYKQLEDSSVALTDGDEIVGVPYVLESYGIIYNKELLNKYFELSDSSIKSVDDINSFKALKTVADGIQKHKDDLGVKGAFTSADSTRLPTGDSRPSLRACRFTTNSRRMASPNSRQRSPGPRCRTSKIFSTCISLTPPSNRLS